MRTKGRSLEAGAEAEGIEGAAYWFAPLAGSAFSYIPGPPAQRWHCPRWPGPPYIHHQSRNCPKACLWVVLIEVPSSPVTPAFVKLTKQNNNTKKTKHRQNWFNRGPRDALICLGESWLTINLRKENYATVEEQEKGDPRLDVS